MPRLPCAFNWEASLNVWPPACAAIDLPLKVARLFGSTPPSCAPPPRPEPRRWSGRRRRTCAGLPYWWCCRIPGRWCRWPAAGSGWPRWSGCSALPAWAASFTYWATCWQISPYSLSASGCRPGRRRGPRFRMAQRDHAGFTDLVQPAGPSAWAVAVAAADSAAMESAAKAFILFPWRRSTGAAYDSDQRHRTRRQPPRPAMSPAAGEKYQLALWFYPVPPGIPLYGFDMAIPRMGLRHIEAFRAVMMTGSMTAARGSTPRSRTLAA